MSESARAYGFRRGLRAWRAYEVKYAYPGGLTVSDREVGKDKRSFVNGARPDGLSEVGSSHSSVEARESAWSEGDDKFAKTFNETRWHWEAV